MPFDFKIHGGRLDGQVLEVDDVTLMFLDTFMSCISGGQSGFSYFECGFFS